MMEKAAESNSRNTALHALNVRSYSQHKILDTDAKADHLFDVSLFGLLACTSVFRSVAAAAARQLTACILLSFALQHKPNSDTRVTRNVRGELENQPVRSCSMF